MKKDNIKNIENKIIKSKSGDGMSIPAKKYYCSKHGNIGDPTCKECIENLRRLCTDKNAYLTGDISENKKHGGKK